MKAIYFTVDIGQVFNDAESSINNFWGPTFLSDTHRDYRFYVPHLFFCGQLNSFFGSSNVGSTLYMQSPMGGGHS